MAFFRFAATFPHRLHARGVKFRGLRAPRLNIAEADIFTPVATILPSREHQH